MGQGCTAFCLLGPHPGLCAYRGLFDPLARVDGKDRIRPLAARIPCDNVRWEQLFYTWFLSMVAHWQGRDKQHGNSLSPLLVGGQGCGKSTFCFNLLPPDLNKYYTDSIDFSKKRDAELYLTRFGLINIDEFDQLSARHQALEASVAEAGRNVRKPHCYADGIGETLRFLYRYEQPYGFAGRSFRQPPFHLYRGEG